MQTPPQDDQPTTELPQALKEATKHYSLWEIYVRMRLDEMRASIPKSLEGVIQYFDQDMKRAFYVVLDGPKTQAHSGFKELPHTAVEMNIEKVEQLFSQKKLEGTAFRVWGDSKLYFDFLDALGQKDTNMSPLALRLQR